MQKIIFLDIDGVLNSDAWYQKFWDQHLEKDSKFDYDLDPMAIDFLNEIKNAVPSVKIVITSTWRFDMDDTVSRLEAQGLEIPVIGSTSLKVHEDSYKPRGVLVKMWLDENVKGTCNYVIFDDDIDFMLDQKRNFIHTDSMKGLQMEDVYMAIAILRGDLIEKGKL